MIMSLISIGKKIEHRFPLLFRIMCRCYRIVGINSIKNKGKNNHILFESTLLRRCKIYINGSNNRIWIQGTSVLKNCTFHIIGDNCNVILANHTVAYNTTFYIEDDNGSIEVGEKCLFSGKSEFAVIEGTKIQIGDNCLFSSNIDVRTGDSHSIVDEVGKRINFSKDIYIGNHNWVGTRVTILKGGATRENTVIGAGAILTQGVGEPNVCVAGIPAVVVKRNINWDINRT